MRKLSLFFITAFAVTFGIQGSGVETLLRGVINENAAFVSVAEAATPSKKEIKDVLVSLIPDVKILGVSESPMSGFLEVAFESGGKKGILYLDKKYRLVVVGNVIDLKLRKSLTQEKLLELNKVDVSQIPLKNALVLGKKGAANKVIVFDDVD
jgi:thiol:disulfide interchange protein DsbC